MKILTVLKDLGPGGTQRAAQNFAIGYKKHGIKSAVLAYQGGGIRAKPLAKQNIPVFIGGQNCQQLKQALYQADNWKPDIIHIHNTGYFDALSGKCLSYLKKEHRKVIETNVFARVDYSKYRELIDIHCLLSKWCLWKWSLWARGIKPSPQGAILPYPVDNKSFYRIDERSKRNFRRSIQIPDNAFVFGRIGQPMKAKWSRHLVPTFIKVANKHPNSFLLLVGAPKSILHQIETVDPKLRDLIKTFPLLETDEELAIYYNIMDCFVHSAQIGESFGMVLAEALLCGCPVVTVSRPFNDNSQLEIVEPLLGGISVSKNKFLQGAMELMITRSDLRKNVSQTAADTLKKRFNIDTVVSNSIEIAHILMSSTNKKQIACKLAEKNIQTHVSINEIKTIMNRCIGEDIYCKLYLIKVIHVPWLYRSYLFLKSTVGRLSKRSLR